MYLKLYLKHFRLPYRNVLVLTTGTYQYLTKPVEYHLCIAKKTRFQYRSMGNFAVYGPCFQTTVPTETKKSPFAILAENYFIV